MHDGFRGGVAVCIEIICWDYETEFEGQVTVEHTYMICSNQLAYYASVFFVL